MNDPEIQDITSAEDGAFDARLAAAFAAEPAETASIVFVVRRRIEVDRVRRWGMLAAAAALVGALGLGYEARKNEMTSATLLAAERDHRVEVAENKPRKWRVGDADIEEASAGFELHPDQIRSLAPAGYRFEHAKICGLAGSPALHAVFTDEAGQPVSVYVRKSDGVQFEASAGSAAEQAGKWMVIAVSPGKRADCERIAAMAAARLLKKA
jgi:hypothetical protein